MDETIVAQDSGRGDKPNRDITDDELYARLLALAQATTNVTLLIDCCHSGTITRDTFTAPSRSVDPDLRPGDQLPPASIPAGVGATMLAAGGATPKRAGLVPIGGSYVLIAGCSDQETSFEYPVAPAGDQVRHGALTFFLLQELTAAEPGTTYRDVFEAPPRGSLRSTRLSTRNSRGTLIASCSGSSTGSRCRSSGSTAAMVRP